MHFIDIPKGRRPGGTKSAKPILRKSSISTTTTDVSELTEDISKETCRYDDLIDKIAKQVASELVKSHIHDDRSCSDSQSKNSTLDIQQIAESLVNNHRRCDGSESGSRCSGSSSRASEAVFHPDFWCAELLDLEDEGSVLGALSTHSRESGINISKDEILGEDDDDISVVSDITSYFADKAVKRVSKDIKDETAKAEPTAETKDAENESEVMLGFTVQFSTITVREYPVMLGENPAVSDGPSITIDWDYHELPELEVETFERVRRNRRTGRSLLLSRKRRENMLRNAGYDDSAIIDGIRHVKKLQAQRRQTVANLGGEKVEEAIQNVSRRVKGMLKFGSRKKQTAS